MTGVSQYLWMYLKPQEVYIVISPVLHCFTAVLSKAAQKIHVNDYQRCNVFMGLRSQSYWIVKNMSLGQEMGMWGMRPAG